MCKKLPIITILALLSLNAIGKEEDGGGTFEYRDNKIYISDAYINEPLVDAIEAELVEHKNIDQIWISNIFGGIVGSDLRFRKLVKNIDIHVQGACYSSCAMVALSAKTLTLHDSPIDAHPTLLIIHGTFNIKTFAWSPFALRDLDFIAERFRAIDKEVIRQALSFPNPQGSGLYIFANKANSPDKRGNVYLCEKCPSNCNNLESIGISELAIEVAR